MIQSVPEAHKLKLGGGFGIGLCVAGQFQRRGHVFQRSHRRNEMKRLKDHPHMRTAEPGQRIFVHGAKVVPEGFDAATGWLFQPAHQHQQG